MSQGNWGGPPPGGGGGWGGGAPPGAPPGGGGYGPPPGGPGGPPAGGYGAPPGGGGYGPPHPGGGGYGAPPGGGYGAPPGGGYGPPPDMGPPPGGGGMGAPMAPIGARAQFNGEGGNLLVTFLLWGIAPIFVGMISGGALSGLGMAIDGPTHGRHAHGPGGLSIALSVLGGLIYLSAIIGGGAIFANKFTAFRFDNLVLDGQKLEYRGTAGQLFWIRFVNGLLVALTFGIYWPWAFCKQQRFVYENTVVNGQPNRLTFTGDGADLLGRYILGTILTLCTFYIYGAWFANDVFAFIWENTKLDGRGFTFRKDPGGFLGTYILTVVLTMCTGGIYFPWGISNILKWEAERVA